jgi:hypothetical protein
VQVRLIILLEGAHFVSGNEFSHARQALTQKWLNAVVIGEIEKDFPINGLL